MQKKVKVWMVQNHREFIDDCGELDCTGLAEAAADHFDCYEDKQDWRPTEDIFDAAVEVGMQLNLLYQPA